PCLPLCAGDVVRGRQPLSRSWCCRADPGPQHRHLLHVNDPLTRAIARAAAEVPGELLEQGARAVEHRPSWSLKAAALLEAASPAWHYKVQAQRITSAWKQCPDRSGSTVAWS